MKMRRRVVSWTRFATQRLEKIGGGISADAIYREGQVEILPPTLAYAPDIEGRIFGTVTDSQKEVRERSILPTVFGRNSPTASCGVYRSAIRARSVQSQLQVFR